MKSTINDLDSIAVDTILYSYTLLIDYPLYSYSSLCLSYNLSQL